MYVFFIATLSTFVWLIHGGYVSHAAGEQIIYEFITFFVGNLSDIFRAGDNTACGSAVHVDTRIFGFIAGKYYVFRSGVLGGVTWSVGAQVGAQAFTKQGFSVILNKYLSVPGPHK